MKKKIIGIVSLMTAVCMLLSFTAFAADKDYGKKLDEALAIYRENSLFSDNETDYVRNALIELFKEDDELFYKLMNKIYGSGDRYSYYMSPETYEKSYVLENSLVGIGVSIQNTETGAVISAVYTGPAKTAGIKPGDVIVEIDGKNTSNLFAAELAELVRGKEGTTVKITVLRDGERHTFTIQRAKVSVSDISAEVLEDGIGYLKIEHFSGIPAFIDFCEAYDSFREEGVNTVILDLRGNPGGNMDCFINIMDQIIPEKGVPYLMTLQAKPFKVKTFTSEGYGFEFNKFVVLVDKNTASASELLAGALQDLGYAVLVGEKTYGKGMAQVHVETSDGDEAIVSALQLKLPLTGNYDGKGLTPDYEVKMTVKNYTLPRLTTLKDGTAASKVKTANVKALEERLYELDCFWATPDDVWDDHTVFGINKFCDENGLPHIGSECKWEIIEKIDEEVKKLPETRKVAEDTQLIKAIMLAKRYAESGQKAQRTDSSKLTFNGVNKK